MKTRSTYYTETRVAAARRNIEAFDWAKRIAEPVIAEADRILAWTTNEDRWRAVTPQSLPRSYAVNQALGSPITGTEIFQYGNYGWLADPLTIPWKIEDPSSGYRFPTNDFGAYYESGRDEQGAFDPDRADRSLLVNELYPEKGPDWGVDDGYGWVDADGNRWTFIAYYVHWWVWYGYPTTMPAVGGALSAFRDAYIYTGDETYATAGLILLDRIADVYPAMDTGAYSRDDGYLASDGLTDRGKVVGSIWETGMAKLLVSAYDAFFPALANGAPDAVAFLSEKAATFDLPTPRQSAADIQGNIENSIIRVVFPAAESAQIRGNFGMHQSAVAMAAVVLDAPDETQPWIDWVFQAGEFVREPDLAVTGGNILPTLVNDVDRDGFGNEAAPGYNALWINNVYGVADILNGYDGFESADLFDHPKFRRMFDNWANLVQLGAYTPTIGDSGNTGGPGIIGNAPAFVAAFERYRDPDLATFAYLLNDSTTDGLVSSIFSEDPEAVMAEIDAIVEEPADRVAQDVHLTGYGFTALRDQPIPGGEHDHAAALWMYFGRTIFHGHYDALNLGLYGFGVDLLPDLGYPEFADQNQRRVEWTDNTISHNTVIVDQVGQTDQWVGQPRGYASTPLLKLVDVEAPQAYPEIDLYRRQSVLIPTGAGPYVVDIFRVTGGTDHHFSFHAAEGEATAEGLALVPQDGGTYAGPDVPLPDPKPGDPYEAAPSSGFTWLDNVERDEAPPARFSVDWTVMDTWGEFPEGVGEPHVRLTMLTETNDVALADGHPPRNKPGNPASLRYLIAHRTGENLSSQFVSIIEPYQGEPHIASIERLDVQRDGTPVTDDAVALRVTHASGRVDLIVSALDPAAEVVVEGEIPFAGSFGLRVEHDGNVTDTFLADGSRFGEALDATALTGTLVGFTEELAERNELVVSLDTVPEDPAMLAGLVVYVENDGERNAAYVIEGAAEHPDGIALDVGRSTLVRGYADPADTESGFAYDVASGAAVRIPRVYTASAGGAA